MNFDINNITRENIKNIKPYSSARDEFSGEAKISLDANENPYNTGLNRYPDPYQKKVKTALGNLKGIAPGNIILGNGSDEIIDLLFRAFCEPGKSNVITLPPTYGMYGVSAAINDIETIEAPLTQDFDIDLDLVLSKINSDTRIVFICSPNNPSGNSLNPEAVKDLLQTFSGLVVVDEAYIDFATQESWAGYFDLYPNLFVSQTFSKAWGLAGLRLGIGFADEKIINILNNIKPPYNINQLTQDKAIEAMGGVSEMVDRCELILQQREVLAKALSELNMTETVYPSDANFLLVKIKDANGTYKKLMEQGIIVRNRSSVLLCENCLRITVGTEEEDISLIKALKELDK